LEPSQPFRPRPALLVSDAENTEKASQLSSSGNESL
jgi:hypothetical protein